MLRTFKKILKRTRSLKSGGWEQARHWRLLLRHDANSLPPYSEADLQLMRDAFDRDYYLENYPDVRNSGIDPFEDFLRQGWKSRRNPSAEFDTAYYMRQNRDVANSGLNPFFHFLKFGEKEGRLARARKKPRSRGGSLSAVFEAGLAMETSAMPTEEVSIVVPVYNGYEHLLRLLPTLERTVPNEVPVFLVDDRGSDPRIQGLLESWISKHPSWRLLTNESNIGFAASVNRGISSAEGHVVVLNTDVDLPHAWLPRLLRPIQRYPDEVASVTPFSNNSSVTGFPASRQELPLPVGESVDSIDEGFRRLPPFAADLVTGVGFCFALNRNAVDRIGLLDEKTYGRGYYEDTDWCQRAALAGFRNVTTNLFVEHNVGSGSFGIALRNEYSRANSILFNKMYPYYQRTHERFIEDNPLEAIRFLALILGWRSRASKGVMIVDHGWGGGANAYAERLRKQYLLEGALVVMVVFKGAIAECLGCFGDHTASFVESVPNSIFAILEPLEIERVIVNGLHGSTDLYGAVEALTASPSSVGVTIVFHDFLAACPTIFLMTNEDGFCGLPDTKACQACLISNVHTKYDTPSIMEWRRLWGKLLKRADRLLVFSDSSANILRKVYPELDLGKLEVADPGYHPALAPIARAPRDAPLRIAVLGAMARHKGSQLVRRLAEHLLSSKARILVFGPWSERGLPGNVRKFGPYAVANLRALMERERIHVVLFPSVCPETFSYTLSEIFALELPVVSLDIGAQGERVRAYKYGVVTSGSSPAELVRALELASAKKREAIQAGAAHG